VSADRESNDEHSLSNVQLSTSAIFTFGDDVFGGANVGILGAVFPASASDCCDCCACALWNLRCSSNVRSLQDLLFFDKEAERVVSVFYIIQEDAVALVSSAGE